MAWTEQCQIAFRVSAENFINKGQKKQDTFRALSKESGIPYCTLKRWYYRKEKESIKNDTFSERLFCEQCKTRKVKRQKRQGEWFYYPKCNFCYKVDAIEVICPHCGGEFKIEDREKEGNHAF